MKHVFLVNPIAGTGKFQKDLPEQIAAANQRHGLDWEIHFTTAPGDAMSYTAAYDPAIEARFYAVGGDGTLNEVVNGILKRSGDSELGLIPCGTGNDFVRVFPDKELFFDLEKQLKAKARPIDAYKTNAGLYGVNMINIGFDADVATEVHRYKKIFPGSLSYIAALVVQLCKKTGKQMEVTVDDLPPMRGNFILSSFANGKACGGGFFSSPKAMIEDGLFEISAIQNVSRLKFLQLVGGYKKGTHLDDPKCKPLITYLRGKKATMKTEKPINIVIDGETVQSANFSAEILPGAIRFAVPE